MRNSRSRMAKVFYRRLFETAARLRGFDAPTVWMEFTPLSNRMKSVNLGQGFPDWQAPAFVKTALADTIQADHNQYCRSGGEVALVEALAEHYGPLCGRKIDHLSEVTTSVGATEGMFAIMQAFINEGDEVVVLEPAFDTYPAQIQMAGGIARYVPLRHEVETGKWVVNMSEFEQAIGPKTKVVLLNTPHNPTGKVFTEEEMYKLRHILLKNPHVIAVCDEVYEKLVFDGNRHVRLASLPDMWERTLTVSSVGKTFSVTGWKVGWLYGGAQLVKQVMLANQWVQYSVSTPTQVAIARILKEADKPYEGFSTYYDFISAAYQKKRDHLVASLSNAHFKPIIPQGGFFIMADTSHHVVPGKYYDEPGPTGESPVTRDWAFARWLTSEVGVTPIPPSAFYTIDRKHLAENLARFAFCKTDASLVEAKKRFELMESSVPHI